LGVTQVGVKLLACKSRAVVMLVVDLADFDGSFPREVVKVLREMPDVQVMLVVTKVGIYRHIHIIYTS
jgi:ribosome biogenesis GTPase A